jgi:Signal transduction histidine kinase
MNNIRSSVHDLHDDSIDVKANIMQMAKPLEEEFTVRLDIDISEDMPRNIKYACIGITKECISNIIKHSHNQQVDISLSEHPSFYQLIIHDYGKRDKDAGSGASGISIGSGNKSGTGMGLENIRSRVESVNGSLNISTDQGYRVFVSIPK